MASWCFDSLEKGYAANEAISQTDSIIRNKNVLLGWEFKAPSGFDNSISTPTQQSVENPCFFEVGIAEMLRKQFPQDSAKNQFNNNDNVGDVFSPNVITTNAISGDDESSSKLSSSVVDSNSRESSLIDLKLGGFGDNVNSNSPRLAPISSADSSTPAKRVRFTSLNSMTIYCQVYGCNKDLSSAKEYHKRHKVCDAHSKTAKVIVNGIEQRFCQQCSRFHLLAEFDDGKRSCRKRLAGHNERRRKPQVGFNSRTERSLHSFTGSVSGKFQGTTLAATSFICQDILGPSHTEKYPTNGWGRHVKVEDGLVNAQKSTSTCINEQLQLKCNLPPYLSEKHFPAMNSLNYNTGLGSVFSENVNPYPHGLVARSLFQAHSLGSEDLTLFDSASTVQGLPGISESGCALSLLSSQSQNSPGSGHSTAIPGAIPLIIPSSSSHHNMSEASEKLFGGSSQSITSGVENRYSLYTGSSTATNHPSTTPVLDGTSVSPDFANGILQGSRFMNVNERLSCEDGTTIDLLQLSSQLQQVENQRQPGLVKQENDGFCCLRIT